MNSYIKNCDCFDGFKEIPDHTIDCIITDMPYNMTANDYDKVKIDLDKLWPEFNRMIKKDGAILMFCQQPFTTKLINSNLKNFKYCWYWAKNQGTGFFHVKRRPIKKIEEIAVFNTKSYNPQKSQNHPPTNSAIGSTNGTNYEGVNKRNYIGGSTERYPTDLLLDFKCVDNYHRSHPNQKPISLLEFFVKSYSNEGDIVLDPFMGSGSTCIAAKKNNRRYIGFELYENFYKIADEKLKKC